MAAPIQSTVFLPCHLLPQSLITGQWYGEV